MLNNEKALITSERWAVGGFGKKWTVGQDTQKIFRASICTTWNKTQVYLLEIQLYWNVLSNVSAPTTSAMLLYAITK